MRALMSRLAQLGSNDEDRTLWIENMEAALGSSRSAHQTAMFAVLDGHGVRFHMPRRSDCSVSDSRIRQGTPCVDYLVKHLPYIILHHPCFEADLESALVHSFTDMDEKLRTAIGDESGSCAVVALLRGGHLFVANLGDSRALLFELPATQLLQVLSAPGTTVTVFHWHWAAIQPA